MTDVMVWVAPLGEGPAYVRAERGRLRWARCYNLLTRMAEVLPPTARKYYF